MKNINIKDIFQVSLDTISTELNNYGEHLTGQRIICPCDSDIFDNESVFAINIEFSDKSESCVWSKTFTLNRIIKATYSKLINNKIIKTEISGDEARTLVLQKVKCNFIKCLASLGEQYGAKSISSSGYDIETEIGVKFQDVDYSQYDLCVTCPPISAYTEFMPYMIEEVDRRKNTKSEFNFILLSSYTDRANPSVGLNIMLGKCYLGYGRHISVPLTNPKNTTSGNSKTMQIALDWITTFNDAQSEIDKTRLVTNIKYDLYKDEFFEMENMTMKDGTHPINVNSIKFVPDNYKGWMFSTVSILDKLSNEEFEWYGTHFNGYFNKINKALNPFNHNISDSMYIHNGKSKFAGVVYRRKNI